MALAAPAAANVLRNPRRDTPQHGPEQAIVSSAPTALALNLDISSSLKALVRAGGAI
jgi:hypothetical protein